MLKPLVVDSIWPSTTPQAPRRPKYVLLTLTLVSLVGLFGWTDGCHMMEALHDPDRVRAAADHVADAQVSHFQQLFLDVLVAHRTELLPLAVGGFLLGLLLWATSLGLLFGRGHLRGLLLQSMCAYAVFLCVGYFVRAPLRALTIDSLFAAQIVLSDSASREGLRQMTQWLARGALALQLAILGGGAMMLTRPRVRSWLGSTGSRGPGRP